MMVNNIGLENGIFFIFELISKDDEENENKEMKIKLWEEKEVFKSYVLVFVWVYSGIIKKG